MLEVSDNGLGISGNINEKIFEPFFTTKPMGDSMGLGLTIVSSIISSFSGKISVKNNVWGGATFRIVFPVSNGTL
ncbi:MAG: ATP-binding protein [Bacillota bacterium]